MSELLALTKENYFSAEAGRQYMSNSQFKAFLACPAAAMAEIEERTEKNEKDCFTEGHMFEAIVCGFEELFYMQNPQIISSQGRTKGQPKSNYIKIMEAAAAITRQPAVMEIVGRCEKQVIVTGEIAGVPYKGCIDLYDPMTGDCWDTKCMRDFSPRYSADEGRKLEWWEQYGYQYQAAIYRELLRQNGRKTARFGLIAATKENVPDIQWIEFPAGLLNNALAVVETLSPEYQMIKQGMIEPDACGCCDWCRSVKTLTAPEMAVMYEEEE